MKKIEVTTAQKVIIQYDLATLRDRIFAFIIDFTILSVSLIILYFIIFGIAVGAKSDEYFTVMVWLFLSPIFILYTLVSEVVSNGRTIGKMAMGLKVIKVNGGLPSIDDYALRWVFRSIDIYGSFGAIAALLISSSDKAQRLGGLLSNTAVVKLREDFKIRLADLERMYLTSDSYEPLYPEIVKFNDEEMLAIKDLINRYQKKPNQAHTDLVWETVSKISKILSLSEVPNNKIGFLQAVLKDYVMLTR